MGVRAWAARSLVVAALASMCVAGVAADPDARDASALGESESRLVDLRYELSVRLPKGVLPCELTPDEGVMHAVEKAVFDAINHDVAPLPRNADVHLACVCEGERCDEGCAEDFHAPEEHVAALAIEAALGAARAPAKDAEKTAASSALTKAGSAAGHAARVRSRSSEASRRAHSSDPAYFAEYGKFLDRDDDVVPNLGSARFYTLYEKCSMNATYYATYEEACSGLTEEDGAYELEHKCRRPDFRRLFGPQCPHPSRTSGQKTTPLVDPVSDFEMCQSKCAATNHCCNNDPEQGSNQHLSCLQACMVVRSGVSGDECLSYCPQKKCAFDIGDARYVTCQTCDDVPAHAVRFGDKYKPAAYNCSAQYGSDEESCQAGCAAGVDSLAETAEEALDDSAEVSEVSSSAASSSDSEDALSSTAADIAIEDWFRDHVGLTGCMPEVPTGQPWYLTLWEKCHYNWVFHKRNAARCEGVTEARGCAELERHCLRLRFAEEYHDQCQGVLLAQQEEEMIENALAAQEADEPEDEPVDIVAAVNAAVDARLTEYGLLTEDGEVATEHISPAQMKVLAEKLKAVIENVTASETSVEEKVDATIAEHLREMVQKESAPAPPAPRAPLSSETELLDAIKKIVKEERLTPAESELVLQEAELFADAIAHGDRVDKIAMTLQAESESAACALSFSIMELDASLGVCVAEVIVGARRSALSLKSYHVTILLSPVTVPAPALEAALEKLADESVTTMTTEIDPAAALEAAVPDADIPTLEPLLETFEAEAEAIVEAEEEEAKIEEARVTSSWVKYPAPGPIIAPSSPPPAPPAPGI